MSMAEGRYSPFSKNSCSLSSGRGQSFASNTPGEVSMSSKSRVPSSVPPEERTDDGPELKYMSTNAECGDGGCSMKCPCWQTDEGGGGEGRRRGDRHVQLGRASLT